MSYFFDILVMEVYESSDTFWTCFSQFQIDCKLELSWIDDFLEAVKILLNFGGGVISEKNSLFVKLTS